MGSDTRIPSLTPLVADLVSYGYAAAVILTTLQLDLQFTPPEGIVIMVVFVLMRAAAREIRRVERVQARGDARRRATVGFR